MEPADSKIKRVQVFYDAAPEMEWTRMDRHPVEFAVTRRILKEYLPSPPAKILDMGGGPGRYAFELAQHGYRVSLCDLSPANIRFAEKKSLEMGIPLEMMDVHDATAPFPFSAGSFDAVLLMGPLYHLTTFELRLSAVANALHVLKPDGILFASFITLSGALRAVLVNDPNGLEAEWRTMKDGLNGPDLGFTEAHFTRIPEIETLMENSGCHLVEMVGCEGFSALFENNYLTAELPDETWQHWVDLNLEFGRHRTALEASDHILYVARKS